MIRIAGVITSLALLTATVAAWVMNARGAHTHYYCDYTTNNAFMVILDDGEIRIWHWRTTPKPVPRRDVNRERLGLGFRARSTSTPVNTASHSHRVSLPAWVAVTLFMVYPTLAFIRGPLRRRRRRRRGQCARCGYDLTGTPQPRCPECGARPRRGISQPKAVESMRTVLSGRPTPSGNDEQPHRRR